MDGVCRSQDELETNMKKHSFQRHVSQIALSRGLPKSSTPHDLHMALNEDVTRRVADPVTRIAIRMFDAPQPGEVKTIEARAPIRHFGVAGMMDSAVREGGDEEFLFHLRRELITAAVRQLLNDDFGDIWREGDEVVVTMTIAAPLKAK